MKTLSIFFGAFILLLMHQSAFSQSEVKTKQVNKNYTEPFPYKESYAVLKDDKNIRHGFYKKENGYGGVFCNGYYKMGKQVGLWTFYDSKDSIAYQLDFDNNRALIVPEHKKNKEARVILPSDIETKTIVDQLAICKVGFMEMLQTLYAGDNMKYPAEARENGIEGTVVVSYYVNEFGRMEIVDVVKSVHPILDQVALNVIQSIASQLEWYPAMKDGKPIKTRWNLPLRFGLTR